MQKIGRFYYLVSLGVCFGYALLANIVGLSVAIGAFLAGVLSSRIKICRSFKNSIQSNKRHVCCNLLCFCWCFNGCKSIRKLYFHCNCINCNCAWYEAWRKFTWKSHAETAKTQGTSVQPLLLQRQGENSQL